MTESDTSSDVPGSERRGNVRLRAVFIDAYDVVQPFFDQANNWAGQTHEHLAYRALHERFPDLSGQEVFTIVAAAKRVFSTSGKPVR